MYTYQVLYIIHFVQLMFLIIFDIQHNTLRVTRVYSTRIIIFYRIVREMVM